MEILEEERTALYTFIVNPTAGAGLALETEQLLRDALKDRGIEARFVRTEHPGHATRLARQAADEGAETVVSVGGDGTGLEIAQGLAGTGAALGIIPAGTGNDLIKTLGIPKKPLEALEHMLSHPARPMDMGTINGKPFLNVCGTGFDVAVLDQTERYKKRFHGLLPYMLGLIRAIFGNKPIQVTIERENGETKTESILICTIANGRYIGGGIPVCPAADPGDGMLDLMTVDSVPRRQIPFYLPGLMRGKILGFKITHHELCKRVRIASPGMRVQIDGEIVSMDEAVFEVRPGALRVHY